jgi:hypothetical protein
LKRESA